MGLRAHGGGSVDCQAAGLVRWRRRTLERAGFPPRLADSLARDQRIDLHALLELIDRGCAPELAARILAPLDDGGYFA